MERPLTPSYIQARTHTHTHWQTHARTHIQKLKMMNALSMLSKEEWLHQYHHMLLKSSARLADGFGQMAAGSSTQPGPRSTCQASQQVEHNGWQRIVSICCLLGESFTPGELRIAMLPLSRGRLFNSSEVRCVAVQRCSSQNDEKIQQNYSCICLLGSSLWVRKHPIKWELSFLLCAFHASIASTKNMILFIGEQILNTFLRYPVLLETLYPYTHLFQWAYALNSHPDIQYNPGLVHVNFDRWLLLTTLKHRLPYSPEAPAVAPTFI